MGNVAVDSVSNWTTAIVEAMTTLWLRVSDFFPNLLAFVVILLVGYLVSTLVSKITLRALKALKIDSFSERVGVAPVLKRANVQQETSLLISKVIFWLIALTFLVSATESLGLTRVSATIDSFVLYIPKVLGAAFILMIGLFIAQFIRDLIISGAEGFSSNLAVPLGSACYGLLVIIVVTLAVGQLDLETDLLSHVISIALLSVGAAVAIAFGIGSREIAGNVLAGNYVREMFKEGDNITTGGQTGVVNQITSVKTEIKLESGDFVSVSNREIVAGMVIRHAK
ncbi:MAG: small-conductance mechanosensitive channel [Candidatus Azotimanducaceae bacterium]|jgi:small-conductance mechanosensitive channel